MWFAPLLNLCVSGHLTTAYAVLAAQERGKFWLGLFQSTFGVLGLIGAAGATVLVTRWRGGVVLVAATSVFTLVFLAVTLWSGPTAYFLFLGLFSLFLPLFNAVLNGYFMATVPRQMIGTASSIMMVSAMGLMPVGAALAGFLVDHWGAGIAHSFFAAVFALAAGGFLAMGEVRSLPGAGQWAPEKTAVDPANGT